jgi:hypothetical protein
MIAFSVERSVFSARPSPIAGFLRCTLSAARWTIALLLLASAPVLAQFHRADQDREISYWLNDPASHTFLISHDFTVSKQGQKYVHSFVRKGSDVAPDSRIIDLDTGNQLKTTVVTGKEVNALGYYPTPTDPESKVVQGELEKPVGEGESRRVRVIETYTDPVGYAMKGEELVWTRTLGRPLNYVTLPDGWMLTSVNTPAVISLDEQGRVKLRFTNIRNGDLDITIKAKKRPGNK